MVLLVDLVDLARTIYILRRGRLSISSLPISPCRQQAGAADLRPLLLAAANSNTRLGRLHDGGGPFL